MNCLDVVTKGLFGREMFPKINKKQKKSDNCYTIINQMTYNVLENTSTSIILVLIILTIIVDIYTFKM